MSEAPELRPFGEISCKRKFVMARILSKTPEFRQGILICENEDHCTVLGFHGTYVCAPDYTVIPKRELFGDARILANLLGVEDE